MKWVTLQVYYVDLFLTPFLSEAESPYLIHINYTPGCMRRIYTLGHSYS
jgi:hypothetical protein